MERKKVDKKLVRKYIIIGIIIYAVLIFYVLHAMVAYQLGTGFDKLLDDGLKHMLTSPLVLSPLPKNALLIIFGGTGALAVAFFFEYQTMKLKRADNPETVNGDARFMEDEDIKEYNMQFSDPKGSEKADGPNNAILSDEISLNIDDRETKRNCNMLVLGGSGAGKSFYFAGPNILQANTNYVITDPAGDLLSQYGKFLENEGYNVRVFNLVDMAKSSRYNPFHYIHEENDIFILVETLIQNTTPAEGHSGDPFWEKSEKTLLNALVCYLWMYAEEKDQTFARVLDMVLMAQVDENDDTAKSPLDMIFDVVESQDPESPALAQYRTFKLGAGKTLKNILISVAVRLNAFTLAKVKHLTSVDELHFEEFGDTKHALFIVIPTADKTFNFLAAMMYSQLFTELYSYVEKQAEQSWLLKLPNRDVVHVEHARNPKESEEAKQRMEEFVETLKDLHIEYNEERKYFEVKNKNNDVISWRGKEEEAKEYIASLKDAKIEKGQFRLPIHVRMILDEFANIGTIPQFNEKLATVRKYQISCAIILQAITQLKTMYKDGWDTIVGNCDTWLYLGGNNQETQKWISEQLGKRTTRVQNESYQAGKDGGGSTSLNLSSIELATVDRLARMKDTDCIVSVRGNRPYFGPKFKTFNHPKFEYAMSMRGTFEIPTTEKYVEKDIRKKLNYSAGGTAAASSPELDETGISDTSLDESGYLNDRKKKTFHVKDSNKKSREEKLQEADKSLNEHARKKSQEYRNNRDSETGEPVISEIKEVTDFSQMKAFIKGKDQQSILADLEANEDDDFGPDEFTFESF